MFDKVFHAVSDDSLMKNVVISFALTALIVFIAGLTLDSTGLFMVAFITSLPAGGIVGALIVEALTTSRGDRLAR